MSGSARGLHIEIRDLLRGSVLVDHMYYGVVNDGSPLVIVEHLDGSRRLLRNPEAAARGLYAWGYGGTGPHTLGEALAIDMLADLRQCPDCFGAIAAAVNLIRCRTCHNTGRRLGEHDIGYALVARVISRLPHDKDWTWARFELLAEACRTGNDYAAEGGPKRFLNSPPDFLRPSHQRSNGSIPARGGC